MESMNPRTVNELFIQKLNDEHEKTALEASTSAFIRTKLREIGFARKVINPLYVTKADLQRSLLHEHLTKIVDIEPESAAMQINLRGTPDVRYVEGKRFEITFGLVSSEEFQKTEEELLSYEMPITEVIERNSIKDIQKIEDKIFMKAINAAITSSGKSTTHTASASGIIDMSAFVKLINVLEESDVSASANPLKCDLLLMNQADFNRFAVLPATTIGSNVAGEQYVNGFKYDTILGRKLIVTNKGETGFVPQGTIYAFAAQEFLGKFYVLEDTKFWVEKKRNLIKWSAYEMIGMGIGNVKAAAKIVISGM